VTTAEQAAGLEPLWGPVGSLLSGLPQADVIADCGRLGADGPYYDLLAHAAAVGPGHPAPAWVRSCGCGTRAAAVSQAVRQRGGGSAWVGVLIVADHRGFSRALAQVAQVLGRDSTVSVLGGIAFEPRSADLLRGEWGGRLDKSLLIRTAREVAGQLAASPPRPRRRPGFWPGGWSERDQAGDPAPGPARHAAGRALPAEHLADLPIAEPGGW